MTTDRQRALEIIKQEIADQRCLVDSPIAGRMVKNRAIEQIRKLETIRAALSEGGVPDGWKLVPIEPTMAMKIAGEFCDSVLKATQTGTFTVADAHGIYKAMLSAAPEAAKGEK